MQRIILKRINIWILLISDLNLNAVMNQTYACHKYSISYAGKVVVLMGPENFRLDVCRWSTGKCSLVLCCLLIWNQLWSVIRCEHEQYFEQLLPNIASFLFPHSDMIQSTVFIASWWPDSLHYSQTINHHSASSRMHFKVNSVVHHWWIIRMHNHIIR